MRTQHPILSTTLAGVAVAGLILALAGPAAAHVTAQPGEATQGGYTAFAFRVPNERPDAGTVRLEVTFPAGELTSVRTKPMTGWTATVTRDGDTVRTVTWVADPGVRIGPDQFQEFEVSTGPLPEDTDELLLPAVQTYDSGEVVAWDDPPAADGAGEEAEPEHPAPVLALLPAGEDGDAHGGGGAAAPVVDSAAQSAAPATGSTDPAARWLGGAGLALGALGLGLGVGATVRGRRRGAA